MSEQKQPLNEEIEELDEVPEEETAVALSETDMTTDSDEETETAEEEPEPEPLFTDKIFGLPRMCFHGLAFGVAGGYILSGIIGLIFGKTPSATTMEIICAAVGYFIANRSFKKKKAALEQEQAEQQK